MAGRTKHLEDRLSRLEKTVERLAKRNDKSHSNGHRPSLKFGDLHGHLERIEKQLKTLRRH